MIISPIQEQKTQYTLTASRVCGLILRDEPPGDWHTDGAPTAAPANARWWSWASMASFQASSTIEYFSSEMISQGVFVNTIASMNHFASSKVACWCWETLWSPPAFGWGTFWSPPGLEVGAPVLRQTRVICWWLTFGVWAMVVLSPRPNVADLDV